MVEKPVLAVARGRFLKNFARRLFCPIGSRALCCLLLRGFIRRQKQMAIKRVLTTVPRSEQWEHREAREPSTTMERSGIVVDVPQAYSRC